jgi:hypothetical protein
MTADGNTGGQKKWWVLAPAMTVAGIIFGAGGVTFSTRNAVADQSRCIEELRVKTVQTEVAQARIDERLRSIDAQLLEIKTMLQQRKD